MRGATPPLPNISPWRIQGRVYFTDAPRITKQLRFGRPGASMSQGYIWSTTYVYTRESS